MDLMVNPVITDFQQDVNGDIKMLKLGANKQDAWANIAEQGGGAKLDNNKTATIDVSTYTEPVVINPTSGKDGMKKATITLSNIPSPSGSAIACAWAVPLLSNENDSEDAIVYFNFNTAPVSLVGNEEIIRFEFGITGSTLQIPYIKGATVEGLDVALYEQISENSFTYDEVTYTRDSTKDFTLWQVSS